MMAAQVMAMAQRNIVCGMYANPKPVSAAGGVLLNKPATTGLLRFGQMRSKREIGCVARGEKEEVGTNKVEPYAECIITRTSELKAGSLWKVQHAKLFFFSSIFMCLRFKCRIGDRISVADFCNCL
jgi:hypothetical protein